MIDSALKRYPINKSQVKRFSELYQTDNKPSQNLKKLNAEAYLNSSNLQSENDENNLAKTNQIKASPQFDTKSNYIAPINQVQQKKRALRKYKYINQLARMQYEDKAEEIHTKFTRVSKASLMMKIKAKNQIAQFSDEQAYEQEGYDELIQFKFGKKQQNFYFQKEHMGQMQFCELCDNVHNDHYEVHQVICEKKRKEEPEKYSPYSPLYYNQSIKRLKDIVSKFKGVQYEELNSILQGIQDKQYLKDHIKTMKSDIQLKLTELKYDANHDRIFSKLCEKAFKLVNTI